MRKKINVIILRITSGVIQCQKKQCQRILKQAQFAIKVNGKILVEQEKTECPVCRSQRRLPQGFRNFNDADAMKQSIEISGVDDEYLVSRKKVVIEWPA